MKDETSLGFTSPRVGGVFIRHFKLVRDKRGDLTVGDFDTEIPFKPERYFLVFNVPSESTRGEHAHIECHQFLICVKGSCTVIVSDGDSEAEIELNSPNVGLYIPPMIWGVQHKYTNDAVLLVFASHIYDPKDYIRDFNEFVKIVGTK
jgi:UDP-2-acetamido-3-amino-2,3-dideoxy-glucuronate N-acetyltransferase